MISVRALPATSAPRLAPAIPPPTMMMSKSLISAPVTNWKAAPSRGAFDVQHRVYRIAPDRAGRDPGGRSRGGHAHADNLEQAQPDRRAARAALLAGCGVAALAGRRSAACGGRHGVRPV